MDDHCQGHGVPRRPRKLSVPSYRPNQRKGSTPKRCPVRLRVRERGRGVLGSTIGFGYSPVGRKASLTLLLNCPTLYDMKTNVLTIRLDKDLDNLLTKASRQSGKNRSEVAREA